MIVKVELLDYRAVLPKYAQFGDAGLDLVAIDKEFMDDTTIIYKTGIAVEIPTGYVGLIFPRSSISKTSLSLCNSVAVIDSGYRGEIVLKFRYTDKTWRGVYKVGDRVAQLIIVPYPNIELQQVKSLTPSDRGINGFGSTGD